MGSWCFWPFTLWLSETGILAGTCGLILCRLLCLMCFWYSLICWRGASIRKTGLAWRLWWAWIVLCFCSSWFVWFMAPLLACLGKCPDCLLSLRLLIGKCRYDCHCFCGKWIMLVIFVIDGVVVLGSDVCVMLSDANCVHFALSRRCRGPDFWVIVVLC